MSLQIIIRPTLLQIGRKGEVQTMLTAWPGGISWRWRGAWFSFRPPWNRPLFSERNGLVRMIWRFAGFRLFAKENTND